MYNIDIITKKVMCNYNLFNIGLNITINNNIHIINVYNNNYNLKTFIRTENRL